MEGIGGDYPARSLRILKKEGMLVSYGFQKLAAGSTLDRMLAPLGLILLRAWDWAPWLPHTSFYSIGAWHKKHFDWFREDLTALFMLLQQGYIRPTIGKVMQLEEAVKAHELLEKSSVKGKIILRLR